jgi:hypothetical protein
VPVSIDSNTWKAIRFPRGAAEYSSVRELFEGIVDQVRKYFRLPNRELRVVAFWVLSTWFSELLPIPPVLIVSGPSPAEVRLFLKLLRCLCRRGVLLTALNSAGFVALPRWLRPTILIDQTKITPSLCELLRAACGTGAYFTKGGDFVNLRCSLAVYCAEDEIDVSLGEGLLRVAVVSGEASSMLLDARQEIRIAAKFQPLMLRYRLTNWRAARESTFDARAFTTGVRELAQALGASVVGDAELQSEIVSLLSRQDEDIRARRTTLPEYGIIAALLSLIHERKESLMPVKKLTDFVNAVLRSNGEIFEYTPEEIGRRLAAMGLYTSRTAGGKAIKLTRQVSRLAHDLKPKYGVTTVPASFPGCADCELSEVPGKMRLM